MRASPRLPLLRIALLACFIAAPATLRAQRDPSHHPTAADSAAVAGTVERFHRALAAGDSSAALALLAPDVLIQESGGQETRAEYRSHHLAADIEFARATRARQSPIAVRVRGGVAWASSTTLTRGEFRGRPIDSAGAELMVLTREARGWRIAAIHWSSHNRR